MVPRARSGTIPRVQRRLLGLLFAALALGLGLVAVYSALEGGSRLGDRARSRGARALDGRPRPARTRSPARLRSPPARGVFSCRGCGRSNPSALAGVPEVERSGASRPAHPHVRAAREVRRRPRGGEPPRARRRAGSRLVRAPRPHRRDRALRSRSRDQVRDVRHGPHPRRDHRRAPLARLGAAFGSHARAPDRARDRRAREGADARADGRGDREEARRDGGGARRQPARDLALLGRGARRAVVAFCGWRLDRSHRHDRGRVGAGSRGLARAERGEARRSRSRSRSFRSARSSSSPSTTTRS